MWTTPSANCSALGMTARVDSATKRLVIRTGFLAVMTSNHTTPTSGRSWKKHPTTACVQSGLQSRLRVSVSSGSKLSRGRCAAREKGEIKVTFTDPQMASVGFTEEEIRRQGGEAITAELPLEHLSRASAARDTRGFVTLVADGSTPDHLGIQ